MHILRFFSHSNPLKASSFTCLMKTRCQFSQFDAVKLKGKGYSMTHQFYLLSEGICLWSKTCVKLALAL